MIGSTHHREVHLEDYVADKLVAAGWLEGDPARYDRHLALYPEDVIGWVQDSQPDVWKKLIRRHGDEAGEALLNRLCKELENSTGGTINVIRKGISIAGVGQISMSQRQPEDERNTSLNHRYHANRLRFVRQLKYNPTREWSIDLVLFINGIPTATIELKTDFTQSLDAAIEQYKTSRLPKCRVDGRLRDEPLLTFKRGAVVHFAMSDSEIAMTTKLDGENTVFLPFNKGNEGRSGNSKPRDGDYPVSYFWKEVCTRENWLRLFHSFVYVEKKRSVNKDGISSTKETLIFPRYHQMDAVNKTVRHVKRNGVGIQYLFEHSAGSGKTSTIAWLSHDLIKIRKRGGEPYFNSVIVVTDRNVLDNQLKDAVQQLDHHHGVIQTIEHDHNSKSKNLENALRDGAPIIVVTIQTFPFAMEAILTDTTLKDRNFAVIIDEAHSSQTGTTAHGLRAALSMDSKQSMEDMSTEDILRAMARSRVLPKNVSNFALTATPKSSTLEMFGREKKVNGKITKAPFHRYTQRQAIEEGYILDVLQNYTPYKEVYRIAKPYIEDKKVDKKLAKRALAKWKSLHPTNISQKVELIVNHFMGTVSKLLDGEAKAMVVTSGRPQAVKYKLAFDKYIKKHNLQGIKALVAFSGQVSGSALGEDSVDDPLGFNPEMDYSEYNLNPDAKGRKLEHVFDESGYGVMIVANKFQTGFNQPKLVAMYLDKKVSGVEAVQTLSRLNRTYPGKDQTYVIDFVNDPKEILSAFKTYDSGAKLTKVQDVDVIYDMKDQLDAVGIYDAHDLEEFKGVVARPLEDMHKKLYALTQRPVDVFNAKMNALSQSIEEWKQALKKAQSDGDQKAAKYAENVIQGLYDERKEHLSFKSDLGKFVRTYSYIAQLIELDDPDLESFSAFAKLLEKRLSGFSEEQVDINGIVLTHFEIRKRKDYEEGEEKALKPISGAEGKDVNAKREYLSQIIERLNEIFGDVADTSGQKILTDHVINIVNANSTVVEQVRKNPKDQALQGDLPAEVKSAVVKAMASYQDLAKVLLKEPQILESYVSLVYDMMVANKDAAAHRHV